MVPASAAAMVSRLNFMVDFVVVPDAHQVVGGLKDNKQGMRGGSGWPNHFI